MNSQFGEIFLFLTDLAWKSRITIPMLVTTVFLIMDIRLQIEINVQSGQMAAAELEQLEDSDDDDDVGDDEHDLDRDEDAIDEEYTTDGSSDDEENSYFYFQVESSRGGDENQNTLNRTGGRAIVSL